MSKNQNIFIFIGPPGAGKGTLAQLCVQHFGWLKLSTGNLCRKHIKEKTSFGKEIDFAIKSGTLISDTIITGMVEDWLEKNRSTITAIILDGYPRTIMQAREFDKLLKTKFNSITLRVICLSISDDAVMVRLNNRFMCINGDCQAVYSSHQASQLAPVKDMQCDRCSGVLLRRDDDEESAIKKRLLIYYQHAKELFDFFQESGVPLHMLNVEKPLQNVFQEFKQLINYGG